MRYLNNKSGFTLTETLVAVLVLTMAIVTATNFIVSMIKSNVMNSNTLQAYYYTQEGIEAFRNMRDTNFMNNVDFCGKDVDFFGAGSNGFCDNENFYSVEVKLDPAGEVKEENAFSSASPWKLSTDPDQKVQFYDPVSGKSVDTIFTRTCKAGSYADAEKVLDKDFSGGKVVEVVCTTTWDESGNSRKMTLSTILTDWKHE